MTSRKKSAKNANSRHSTKNPKPLHTNKARNRPGRHHQTSNWSGSSSCFPHDRSKAVDHIPHVTEKIPTSNIFAPLTDWHSDKGEKTAGKPCHETQAKIFSVASLDKQIKIFNFTRYARANRISPCLGSEGSAQPFITAAPSSSTTQSTSAMSPPYIPPHQRAKENCHLNPKSSSPFHHSSSDRNNMVLIISDQFNEEQWIECQEVGLFAYWNGPTSDLHRLIDWLDDFCGAQVCISKFSDSMLYLRCYDELVKKDFINITECMFKGHAVQFLDWIPNCNESNLDLAMPTWYVVHSLPPELKNINILKKKGRSIGNLIGMDLAYETSNNVKFLISSNINDTKTKQLKIITNRSKYDLEFTKYEGKILDIIKLDDERSQSFNMMDVMTDLSEALPVIRRRKFKMFQEDQTTKECFVRIGSDLFNSTPLKANHRTSQRAKCHKNRAKSATFKEDISFPREENPISNKDNFSQEIVAKDSQGNQFDIPSSRPRLSSTIVNIRKDKKKGKSNKKRKNKDRLVQTSQGQEISDKGKEMSEDNLLDQKRITETSHEKVLESFISKNSQSALQQVGSSKDNQGEHLEELENLMFFTTCGTSNNNVLYKDPTSPQSNLPREADIMVESPGKLIFFWQTPAVICSSPFTPCNRIQQEDSDRALVTESPIKEFQDFLNKDCITDFSNAELDIAEKERLKMDQLAEELAQVFYPENIEDSSMARKEELIQKVIQLGGENYSCEDLRRDILKIQREDTVSALSNQSDLAKQIFSEFGTEYQEHALSDKVEIVQTTEIHLEQLGIYMSQEGSKSPNCGRIKGKRGRKSLKELREAEGLSKEHQKIDQIFYNGKGKDLPDQV